MVIVSLSGCTLPLLQNVPFLSRYSAAGPEKSLPPKPVDPSKAAALPAVGGQPPVLKSPAPSPPKVEPSPPVVVTEVIPLSPAPAAPGPLPEVSVQRSRHASTGAALSYVGIVLTEDTTWAGEVFIEEGVTVAPQATLTVEAGTTVRFRENAILFVQGRLTVNGTAEQPVLLTSEYVEMQPGDWQGIFLAGSEKNNVLTHCIVEGADTGLSVAFSRISLTSVFMKGCRTGASFDDSFATIRNGGFRKGSVGIVSRDSELDMHEVDISANRQGLVASTSSVSLEGCSLFGNEEEAIVFNDSRVGIRGNSITGNGKGAVLVQSQGTVAANRIVNNAGTGIQAKDARIRVNGNDISGNGGVGLHVTDGRVIGWGNVLTDNDTFNVYNAGKSEATLIGNWWGMGSEAETGARIHGRHRDSSAGVVRFLPFLKEPPPVRP